MLKLRKYFKFWKSNNDYTYHFGCSSDEKEWEQLGIGISYFEVDWKSSKGYGNQ